MRDQHDAHALLDCKSLFQKILVQPVAQCTGAPGRIVAFVVKATVIHRCFCQEETTVTLLVKNLPSQVTSLIISESYDASHAIVEIVLTFFQVNRSRLVIAKFQNMSRR